MKKILYLIPLCFILLFLSSCGERFPYKYEDMKEKVVKVEIIKITFIDYDSSNVNEEYIKELSENEIEEFLSALSLIKFTYPFGSPRELQGYIFVIYYSDGEYEKLSRGTTKMFDADHESTGGFLRQCTEKEFNDLLSIFIDIV